jgi:undecaprenyl-diphosphatase
MKFVSWFGYTPQSYLMAALALCALLWLGLRVEALALASVSVLEELLNMAIKALVHRPRPSASLVHVVIALKSYSFPSGHVMFYTCFFGFLFYLAHMLLKPSRLRAALLALFGVPVLAIGLSRVYLGEHWASDVLAAYLAGFIALMCGIQLYRWGKNRSPAKLYDV